MATNTETFKVAGISHYKDAIIENFVFDDDDEFDYESSNVELIPEPENEYDPNAIKVLVNGIKIGYVPKDLTTFARNIIDSPNYSGAKVTISGEKSYVLNDDDEETEEIDLWARIHLTTQFESEEEKKSEKKLSILAAIELTLGILLLIASIIITKVSFIFFALLIIAHSLYWLFKEKNQ